MEIIIYYWGEQFIKKITNYKYVCAERWSSQFCKTNKLDLKGQMGADTINMRNFDIPFSFLDMSSKLKGSREISETLPLQKKEGKKRRNFQNKNIFHIKRT